MWEKEIQFGLEFIGNFHQKSRYFVDTIKLNSPTRDLHLAFVWIPMKNKNYFTIQFIFITIHGFYCTFWYYSWVLLYYFGYIITLSTVFSAKSFQIQLNKLFPNRLEICNIKVIFVYEQ